MIDSNYTILTMIANKHDIKLRTNVFGLILTSELNTFVLNLILYRVSQKNVLTLRMTRKPLFMNIEWNEIASNTWDKCNWRIMFANVQIDDHYKCTHSFFVLQISWIFSKNFYVRAMYELTSMQCFLTHGLDEGAPLNTLRVPQT